MSDYYELLGVATDAAPTDIRQAYLRLAKQRHPDRFSDPTEKERAQAFFKELTAAFNTLFNPGSRREYDAQRQRPRPQGPEEIARDAFGRGLKMLEEGSHEDAVTLLRTAVHNDPKEARYHAALGRALGRHPKTAREAVQSLERAIQISPQTASFHAELAQVLHGQGLKLRAQKAAETALRLAPRDAQVQKVASLVGLGSGS